jgi:hypothetical protein
VLLAAALLIFSAAGYERVKSYMDSLSFDGDAFTFSPALYATLTSSGRIAAAALLAAAALFLRFHARVANAIDTLIAHAVAYTSRTVVEVRRALHEDTPAHLAALLAIVVFGVVLRVRVLWQPINYDESFTYIVYANRPWLIAWANYSEPNNHLLHTLLAHLSIGVFGNAVWAIRLPALVAGCLAIPLAYAVGRRIAGRDAGLLVGALTASSQMLIAFSVCARGYSMLLDLFLLAILCGLDVIATRAPHAWPAFVVSCVLGFFTIPVFLYAFVGLLAWLFLAGRRDRNNAALHLRALIQVGVWTLALVALCYAPAFVTSRLQAGINFSRGTETTLAFLTTLGWDVGRIWLDMMRGLPAPLIAFVAVSAALGIWRLRRDHAGAILILPLLLWPALIVPLQRTLAPARAWIYLLPLFFVYSVAGVLAAIEWIGDRIPRRWPALTGAAVGAMALAVSLHAVTHLPAHYTEWNNAHEFYAYHDLDEVAGYLKTSLAERDALVAAHLLDFPLEYYLRVHGVPIAFLRRPPSNPERVILLANESVEQPIARVLKSNGFDPERMKPRLVRRFTYSSLYEVQPRRGEP